MNELTKMINSSPCMDEADKAYWIELLPHMSTDHIVRLTQIMTKEEELLKNVSITFFKKLWYKTT